MRRKINYNLWFFFAVVYVAEDGNKAAMKKRKKVQKSMNHGIEWMELALLSRFFSI